ncbi:hypothetical protein LguiA_033343 [Lonicera macranthoides]
MVPNLDLILLALLHGSFISCVLILVLFIILMALLLAFSIGALSIVVIDSFDLFSLISRYVATLRANIELGFILILVTAMHFIINAAIASKPWFNNIVSKIKENLQWVVDQANDYKPTLIATAMPVWVRIRIRIDANKKRMISLCSSFFVFSYFLSVVEVVDILSLLRKNVQTPMASHGSGRLHTNTLYDFRFGDETCNTLYIYTRVTCVSMIYTTA